MESLTKSHIYSVLNIYSELDIYAISKTIAYLLLQSLIILFCLTLTLNLAINSKTSQSRQINQYGAHNLNSPNKLEDIPVNVYQGFKEKYKIKESGYEYNLNIKKKNAKNIEILNVEKENSSNLKTARASWYGPRFYGKRTASGELFTKDTVSFAHKTLPFGTKVRFYYKDKTVIAHCNDRGPFKNRAEFDLSYQTKKILGFSGVKSIKYEILDDSTDENIKPYEFCSLNALD
jgi:rare lipoprotein A